MRVVVLLTLSALVAGCSHTLDSTDTTARTPLSPTAPRVTTSSGTPTTTSTAKPPVEVEPGAPINDVITWIEAGAPVAPEDFGSVSRQGVSTEVDGVAFTTTYANCISTPAYRDGALACLVKLTNPPPRPPDAFTVWKGNWVDFDGSSVDIGSMRGDPGPFGDGTGAELPAGQSLAFGDFRCRADTAGGVLCVNYAQRSGARFTDTGIDGFGCLQQVTPPEGIGIRLSC